MKALLKIEYLSTKRDWFSFIMGIGMPVLFFIFFSSMFEGAYSDVALITRNYMLTMTAFSMSSFALFSFPMLLEEDKKNHWLLQIQHSPLPLYQYYSAKLMRVFVSFLLSIIITFTVGALFRDVQMTPQEWLLSTLLLLGSSLVYLAIGLALTLLNNLRILSVVANILFLSLAIFGGSWMPYETFPDWMKSIAHLTPSYYANQLVLRYVNDNRLSVNALLMMLLYTILILAVTLIVKKKQEVR